MGEVAKLHIVKDASFSFMGGVAKLHIVKDVVVVKLFPSIHLSSHPSNPVEGIL
jgi:hypothetical protein